MFTISIIPEDPANMPWDYLGPKLFSACEVCEESIKVVFILNMIGKLAKESTKIAGLAVAANPHHNLTVLYDKLLKVLSQMPDTAVYKQTTKAIVDERFNLVKTIKDAQELENKINSGQIEEVIKEAEYELILARKMLAWKPWEPLIGQPPKDQWKWPVA